jgi:3-hydroxyacyl-[acyl-carrier-protein] dehydratase
MTELRAPLCIAVTHPSLPGHFPGEPIVPGVVILDEVQSAARALAGGGRLAALPAVKFLAPLRPGERAECVLERRADGAILFRVERAGAVIAQGSLRFDAP